MIKYSEYFGWLVQHPHGGWITGLHYNVVQIMSFGLQAYNNKGEFLMYLDHNTPAGV